MNIYIGADAAQLDPITLSMHKLKREKWGSLPRRTSGCGGQARELGGEPRCIILKPICYCCYQNILIFTKTAKVDFKSCPEEHAGGFLTITITSASKS